jgi:cytochrome P450
LITSLQAKVRDELDGIFGGDSDRPATVEDLSRMKYLGNVFKEALRLYPIVPCLSRISDEDIVIEVSLIFFILAVILYLA